MKCCEYMNCELIQELLPETRFCEFGGIFADGPEILPFRCSTLPAAGGPKSALLPQIAFHKIRGKSAENAISRLGRFR